MKFYKLFLATSIFCIVFNFPSTAQSSILSGKVLDLNSNLPIDSCSIKVIDINSKKDTLLFYTDLKGLFTIKIDGSKEIQLIFYKVGYNIEIIDANVQSIIERQLSVGLYKNNSLKEVSITAKKPRIVIDAEKTVFFPTNIASIESIRAADLLKYVPGIFVESSQVRLNGKANVDIYIDEKKRTLSNEQAIKLLQSIPANQIEKIEIIEGSSRFDATSSNGIINIVMKRNKLEGYNLNLINSIGFDHRFENSHTIAAQMKKNRMYYNLLLSFDNKYTDLLQVSKTDYVDVTSKTASIDTSYSRTRRSNPYINFNVDYDLNRLNNIAISTSVYFDKSRKTGLLNSHLENSLLQKIASSNYSSEKDNLNTIDLEYTRKLDSLGSKVRLLLGYLNGFNQSKELYNNITTYHSEINENEDIRLSFPLSGNQIISQLDVNKNINKKYSYSFGLKHTSGSIVNDINYDYLTQGIIVHDSIRSTYQKYQEIVNALYSTFKGTINDKISYLVGFRFENSIMRNYSLHNSIIGEKTFNNIFPSLSLSYSGEKIVSRLGISRSIRRPYYGYLNDYVRYLDEYNILQGNNQLLPSFTSNLFLTNLIFGFINFNVGVQYTKDGVQLLRKQDQLNPLLTISRPVNAFNTKLAYFNLSPSYELFNGKWSGQLSFGGYFFYTDVKPEFATGTLDNERLGQFYLNNFNTFKLGKDLNIDFNFNYLGKNKSNQLIVERKIIYDFGLRKSILNKKMTLTFYVNDLFLGQNHKRTRIYDKIYSNIDVTPNLRRFVFSLTYNIGSLKDKSVDKRGTQEVSERFKQN